MTDSPFIVVLIKPIDLIQVSPFPTVGLFLFQDSLQGLTMHLFLIWCPLVCSGRLVVLCLS